MVFRPGLAVCRVGCWQFGGRCCWTLLLLMSSAQTMKCSQIISRKCSVVLDQNFMAALRAFCLMHGLFIFFSVFCFCFLCVYVRVCMRVCAWSVEIEHDIGMIIWSWISCIFFLIPCMNHDIIILICLHQIVYINSSDLTRYIRFMVVEGEAVVVVVGGGKGGYVWMGEGKGGYLTQGTVISI